MTNDIRIRYQTIDRRQGAIIVRERSFPTAKAMETWIAKQEALAEAERGGFLGVLAYSGLTKTENAE